MNDQSDITALIAGHRNGVDGSYDAAVALLYDELRVMAHHQLGRRDRDDTLGTTALVHEAYMKMMASSGSAQDRSHFLAIAATAMRHVIIDYARGRMAAKRGSNAVHCEFDERDAPVESQAQQLVEIDAALDALAQRSTFMAKVFECKFFGGLDDQETADGLGMSLRTAQRNWQKARAFLGEYLNDEKLDARGRNGG